MNVIKLNNETKCTLIKKCHVAVSTNNGDEENFESVLTRMFSLFTKIISTVVVVNYEFAFSLHYSNFLPGPPTSTRLFIYSLLENILQPVKM